ncbi:MAG: hypothetical protein Kow0090_09470 [Myxococcota bacterium]
MEERRQSAPPADDAEERLFRHNAQEFIVALASMLKMAQLYEPTNKIYEKPSFDLANSFAKLAGTNNTIITEQVGEEFFINRKLVKPTLHTYSFHQLALEEFQQRGVGGLSFAVDMKPAEIIRNIVVFMRFRPKNIDKGFEEFNELLSKNKIFNFASVKPVRRREEYSLEDAVKMRRKIALTAYQNAVDYVRSAMANLDTSTTERVKLPDAAHAKRIVQKLVDLSGERGRGFVFVGLAAIRNHDEYTYTHVVNVSVLSIAFGRRLGLSKLDLGDLGMAALFHDFGKVEVPLAVLNKPSKFTEDEWQTMQDHSAYGVEMLEDAASYNFSGFRRVLAAVQHHQNYNMTGYPPFRIRRRPHIFARLIAIADAYDAMTTNRVYQRALTPDEAMRNLLRMAGTRYDPVLVRAFISAFGVYPLGSLVLLNDGRRAVVSSVSQNRETALRPEVKLVSDAAGNDLGGLLIDLSAPKYQQLKIVRCLDPELEGINLPHYLL